MSKPTGSLLGRLGPEAEPFERFNRKNPAAPRTVGAGEAISFATYVIHISSAGVNQFVTTTRNNLCKSTVYLWVIDVDGLHVILESTRNPAASRGCVCHSNISAGAPALQGGELWFLSPDSIVINFRSGRYGAETIGHEDAVIEHWQSLGFTVEVEN